MNKRITTDNLKSMLKPRDRGILDAQSGTNWVPPEPRELLLPYIEEDKEVDRNSIEFRRNKAREVYDGYGNLITRCKEIEEEIEFQCKEVVVSVNPTTHLRVKEAIQRVFPGSDGKTITFEMYQRCIKELAATSDNNIPKPTDKGE